MNGTDISKDYTVFKDMLSTDETKARAYLSEMIAHYGTERVAQAASDSANRLTEETDQMLTEITIKAQLAEVSEIISLSYLAKHYFNRSKAWLYQRINGNTVNGRPCRFTPQEIETFNRALQDISKRIGSLTLTTNV